jgi:hypothetical protein
MRHHSEGSRGLCGGGRVVWLGGADVVGLGGRAEGLRRGGHHVEHGGLGLGRRTPDRGGVTEVTSRSLT